MTIGENIQINRTPNESYRFIFSKEELNEIYHLQRKIVYKKNVKSTLSYILLSALLIFSSISEGAKGFGFGILFVCIISIIKGIRSYNKAWKNSIEYVCKSVYGYEVFEDYVNVLIFRNNEKIRESKCYFTDIQQMQPLGNWLLLQFGGQTFILRKSDLKENSAFFRFCVNTPSKVIGQKNTDKWTIRSIVLFAASLLSIFVALALVGLVSGINGLFYENMWLFFLLTPIPIMSIGYGFFLKSKGYKYIKNIIVGIIMLFLLCIYGSFSFIY